MLENANLSTQLTEKHMEANICLALHSTSIQGKQGDSLNPFTLQIGKSRHRQTFPVKGQIESILGFVGYTVSV